MVSFDVFAVRGDNGALNVEASCEKFAEALLAWESETREARERVSGLVHSIFDKAERGKRLSTEWILCQAQFLTGADQDAFKTLKVEIGEFLKNSNEFHSKIGRGGGVGRIRDLDL